MWNKVKDAYEEACISDGALVATLVVILVIIAALAGWFGIMCLQSWIVMLLWNWVAVATFDLPVVTFWTAFGIRWLCSLLFKSHTTVNKSSD